MPCRRTCREEEKCHFCNRPHGGGVTPTACWTTLRTIVPNPAHLPARGTYGLHRMGKGTLLVGGEVQGTTNRAERTHDGCGYKL